MTILICSFYGSAYTSFSKVKGLGCGVNKFWTSLYSTTEWKW